VPIATTIAHQEHPDFRVFGLLTFLISESLMFGGFFATYLILRGGSQVWPPEGTKVELLVPAINTIVLVSSSFVIHLGDTAIKQNDVAKMRLWYGVTALMGALFLGGQVYEYLTLGYGLTTNVFSNCFYLMTGFHGLHVFVGLLLILGVLWRSRRSGHYSATKHTGIEMAEIYFYRHNDRLALQVALKVIEQVRASAGWTEEWSELAPILVDRQDDPQIRLYLNAYAASGLIRARLGELDESREIATRVSAIDGKKEFGASVVLGILDRPADEDE
jgi:cytochrome c oxidase subunit III